MYAIKFTQTAEKQFNKLEAHIQDRIIEVLERIRERSFHFVKRKEGTPYFILRIGDYRAVLDIEREISTIFVMEVGHRKNIYG